MVKKQNLVIWIQAASLSRKNWWYKSIAEDVETRFNLTLPMTNEADHSLKETIKE